MIKQPFILFTLALLAGNVQAQKPYSLQGDFPGAADGTKVYLLDAFEYKKAVLQDSAVIKDGHFQLKGKAPWGFGRQVQLFVEKTPGVPQDRRVVRFFMGDEDVKISCQVDSLPGSYYGKGGSMNNVVITGARSQDVYASYKAGVRELSEKYSALNAAYMKEYHLPAINDTFNTARGIELAREMKETDKQLTVKKIAFIKENRSSVVAAYMALEVIAGSHSSLTAAEIDGITAMLSPKLATSTIVKELKRTVANEKVIAKGAKYIDIPLINRQGKTVQLSSMVKPGQYNMLEFWASWCGPCRAEIPHLRALSKSVKSSDFNIISVSIDERKADWEKAMNEEKMEWTQLCDMKGFSGPVSQRYKVEGIPFSIVIDPNGKIVASEIRGAVLDALVKDLLGDKVTAF
ncbi:TlpA disulfide reductase family protein [Chitinophaga sp. Cy-1792]|uniref:TlpA disulfide reductase family protein n=1 Tax=Chitinophaga sp. Cy-1792 TaxID=2608339 RepID=UPI00141E43E4|nr:TlpA disulfide reductase family protein [Chitinophaga sp. Cy-1792]NIG57575.1 AhpC/TSA family protein [Chitinophaga sp. Cy-1792]